MTRASSPGSSTMHPIALVRKKAQATNQQRLLLTPVGDLVATLLPHSRRGARLLERIALERPAVTLSTLLAELSATGHKGVPRVLVDKLADALHAHLDHLTPITPPVHPQLAVVRDKLLDLRDTLERRARTSAGAPPVEAHVARLTLEVTPPAMFFVEGRGLESVPSGLVLSLARARTPGAELAWSAVRGASLELAAQRYATERALDVVLEPILDEEERLLAMLSSQRVVKLAHVGGGGLRVTLPHAELAADLGLSAEDADAQTRAPLTYVVLKRQRALDVLAVLAARDDVALAWSSVERTRTSKLRAQDLRVRAGVGRDWLDLEGGIALDDGSAVSVQALLDALREGRRYVIVKDAARAQQLAAITDELADALAPLAVATSVPALLALAEVGATVEGGGAFDTARAAHERARLVDGTPAAAFVGELRPYQREGLRFLRRVVAWQTGGVLADDMGLGKTRTALALLVDRAPLGPQLVITPTSVLHAWRREAAACAPSLRVVAYGGAAPAKRRAALADVGAGDVVLASYGVVQRDLAQLAQLTLATLVLDEAQHVKNASALRSRGVRSLAVKDGARLALTGTPLENHTGELWAVLHAVSPGVFGSWAQFKARFAQPIEKDHDVRRRNVLARAIAPFVLRRTKAQVAPELPPKIDVERVLELQPVEQRAYEDLRKALLWELERPDLADVPKSERDQARKRTKILAALTKLRLCACHPALASDLEVPWDDVEPGSKQRALVDLLLELKAEGHHALVFSQFVRHLRLARAACSKLGITSLELVGETPVAERARLVDAFQAGEADAFFISLKAGGFGLTLTRATTVVHLDPWWNPATEDQATDRAHRIGQTLPVTVVRLIAGGTLEEKILELHEHKRALVDAVLEGTDRAGTLSTDDLLALVRSSRRTAREPDGAQELALEERVKP